MPCTTDGPETPASQESSFSFYQSKFATSASQGSRDSVPPSPLSPSQRDMQVNPPAALDSTELASPADNAHGDEPTMRLLLSDTTIGALNTTANGPSESPTSAYYTSVVLRSSSFD